MFTKREQVKMKGVIMDAKQIGTILTELRNEKGKTVTEAAKDLNISVSALSMYENGERIPRDNIKIRIAEYYNKSIVAIFFAKQAHEA